MANVSERFSRYFPYGIPQVNYLVNCSVKHKFVYVETPKVACSTIKRALQIIEVGGDESRLPKQVHDRGSSPLVSPTESGVDPEVLFESERYFRFSFVRNPFSRILSAYLDKIVVNEWERSRLLPSLGFSKDAKPSLLEFLLAIKEIPDMEKDIHWTPQCYLLQKESIKYNFIGRFENFSLGFQKVMTKICPASGVELSTLRYDSHKTSARDKLSQYIGQKEKDVIIEIFEGDFLSFGYSFDVHFGSV